jgi:hypothetical protein
MPRRSERDNGYFRQAGQQIGATATNDFIFGELHLHYESSFMTGWSETKFPTPWLSPLPDAPPVEILETTSTLSLSDLAALLGESLPSPLPTTAAALKALEDELRNRLKLEAPLAVQLAQSTRASFRSIIAHRPADHKGDARSL